MSHHQNLELEKGTVGTFANERGAEKGEASAQLDIPDGGWRAWLVVLGIWIVQFVTFGYTNAYGVYNDFYVREYLAEKYSSAQISWIGSVQLLLVLSVGLISGRGFDTGYYYHLMIGGSILFIFCLFMLSLTQPGQYYQIFLAQGLGLGFSIGALYVPGMTLISQYFNRRRPLAMGIAASGSAVGGALHPIMLNKLFYGPVGFHAGVRASAGLNLGLLVIAICLAKPRLPPSRSYKNITSTLQVFLGEPPYLIMVIGTVLVFAGLYYPIFFIQLNAIKNGVEPGLAFYTIAILNGASVVGRVIPNLVAHRVGVFNMIVPCISIAAILVFCTLAVQDVAGTMIFAVLYGLFSGAYAGLIAPTIASLAKNDSEIGARMGICFTFTGLGGLLGTPIAGALLTTSFVWWRPILFSGLCVTCGSLCFFVCRYLIAKRKGTQWL